MLLGEEDEQEVRRRLYQARIVGARMPDDDAIVVVPLAGIACAMLESDKGNPHETDFLRWVRARVHVPICASSS